MKSSIPTPTLFFYLVRESIPYYFLTFCILTTLIFSQQMVRQTDLIAAGLPPQFFFQIILNTMPGVLMITIPFSCLFATLLSISRLASDQEIIGINSAGIRSGTVSISFITLSVLAVFMALFINFSLIPASLRRLRELKTTVIKLSFEYRIRPQTLSTSFKNHIVYIKDADKTTGDWTGVFVVRQQPNNETLVLSAEKGQLRIHQDEDHAVGLQLINGIALIADKDSPQPKSVTRFTKSYIKLAESTQQPDSQPESFRKEVQEMPSQELKQQLQTTPHQSLEHRIVNLEWHKRVSLAFSSLALTLTAILIGFSGSRTFGRTALLSIGFSIAVIYYLLILAGQNLALTGAIPPILGLWGGDLAILVMAITINWFSHRTGGTRPSLTAQPDQVIPDSTRNRNFSTAGKTRSFFSLKPLSLLNYLIISETIKYTVLSLGILTITVLVFTLFDIVPSLSRNKIPSQTVAAYLWFLAPQILFYTAPFGIAIGIIAAFAVLSRTNQITSVFSHGQSSFRVILPALGITCLLILGLVTLSETLLPYSNREQDFRYNQIKARRTDQVVLALEKKWVLSSDKTLYSFSYLTNDNQLLNTTAYSLTGTNGVLCQITYAARAARVKWNIWEAVAGGRNDRYCDQFNQKEESGPVRFSVSEGADIFRRVINESSKMNRAELRKYIKQLAGSGGEVTALRVDYEKKVGLPVSCLALTFIALPFCLSFTRKNTTRRIAIGIGLCIIFWIFSGFLETLGKQSLLPIWLSVWGGHIIFTALGFYLFLRLKK